MRLPVRGTFDGVPVDVGLCGASPKGCDTASHATQGWRGHTLPIRPQGCVHLVMQPGCLPGEAGSIPVTPANTPQGRGLVRLRRLVVSQEIAGSNPVAPATVTIWV